MLIKLAFRNILRQKRRSILTIATISAGFAFGSISIGIQTGSFNQMIDTFTRAYLGHIQIHNEGYLEEPTLYNVIRGYEIIGDELDGFDFIEGWAPRLYFAGLVSVDEKSDAVSIVGIDPKLENQTTHFDGKIVEGTTFSSAPNEVILGKGLMDALDAKIGDELVLVVQSADGSMGNDLYRIVGKVDVGNEASNRMSVYMQLDEAQEIMVMNGQIHEIAIIIGKISRLNRYYEIISAKLQGTGISLVTWRAVNPNFAEMVDTKKGAFFIIQFVIMLIVAVGVLNTVLMSVLERTREFGVLKALGTRPPVIFRLIIVESAIMSVFGMIFGSIFGTAINLPMAHWGIKTPHSYDIGGILFDTMKSEVTVQTLTMPAIIVLFTALFVSIFPAIRAARTVPAKSLRFH
ncbi:MAG TPA: ABC transporter permease [candidate division Zixibacteria bacterium]|nr:ABC transporter permease [candidate division Zixibacteria bacterium]